MTSSFYRERDVAAAYDRLFVPYLMTAPATDLVRSLGISAGDRALDVGCGTGAATLVAARTVQSIGRVVALDPSIEMLRILQTKKIECHLVMAAAPGLPFPDRAFDDVLTSFVLAHLQDYRSALADMVRVLRPGGRLGATAWAAGRNEFNELWKEVVGTFVSIDRLDRAFRDVVPWDERFSQEAGLQEAFEEARLARAIVERRDYRITMSLEDYLALREASLEGRLARELLPPDTWQDLRRTLLSAFRSRFPEAVAYERSALLASGTKRR